MWDWVTSRPRYCLKIGARDLAWAEVRRDWRGRPRYQCSMTALPEGVMRLSPLEQNIALPDELETRIRGLVAGEEATRDGASHSNDVPRAVTVILPDLAVRLAVLQLQDLPWSSEEREALIRWRLGQEQLLSLSGTKVFSQVLNEPSSVNDGPYTVLAVAVQETVLAQYESVCEAAGLIPQVVDVASLRLFNLWAQGSGGARRVTTDFLWINAIDGGLTAFVFHRGNLVFVRSKLQGASSRNGGSLSGREEGSDDRIVQECADSVYACQQQTPDLAVAQVVVMADDAVGSGLPHKLEKGLGVPVKELDWANVRQYGGGRIGGPQSNAVLPALAGVL